MVGYHRCIHGEGGKVTLRLCGGVRQRGGEREYDAEREVSKIPPEETGMASTSKPYWEMTTAELRKATAEFDREFVGDTFGRPTPEQMAQFERAKRKRGRPRNGMGSKTISVTVEAGLLAKTDRLAKKTASAPRRADRPGTSGRTGRRNAEVTGTCRYDWCVSA